MSTTTMHGTAKGWQQAKLRKSLRDQHGPFADFTPVPSSHQLDTLPYHACLATANEIYDALKAQDPDLTSLPIETWQYSAPRLHCRLVDVELAVGFNRAGYLRIAKSYLGVGSIGQLVTALLRARGRYAYLKASPGMRRLYASWFAEVKAANLTKILNVRSHYARYFVLLYEALAYEHDLRGYRANDELDKIVAAERLNAAGNFDLEPTVRMRNQVTRVVMQLLP